jgi:hypothetical protein
MQEFLSKVTEELLFLLLNNSFLLSKKQISFFSWLPLTKRQGLF